MTAIIIDDEQNARETLSVHLRSYCPQIVLKGVAKNGVEGLTLYRETKPDIVFLDVEMPEMNGFEVLERISTANTSIIFVTAFNKYARRAFDFAALDFLEKPIEPTRLVQAVHRALERYKLLNAQNQYTMLIELINQRQMPSNQGDMRIAFATQVEIVYSWLRNLVYIKAEGSLSCVRLIEHSNPLVVSKHLGAYESQFEEAELGFMMRVHNSYLVNLYHVNRFMREDYVLEMSDGEKIPLSERQRTKVLQALRDIGR